MHDAPYRLVPAKAPRGVLTHTKVSPEDYEWAMRFSWWLTPGGYVRRRQRVGGRRRLEFLMHRELLGLVKGDPLTCDHINRDRLDNRRSNLRPVTMAENNRNIGSTRDTTSSYRGVCWYAARGKWRAAAEYMHRATYLGDFGAETDAARAVNAFWVERGYPAPNEV